MKSKERLLTALNHEEPDFVPNTPRIWAWLLGNYGNEHYLSYVKAAERFDLDVVIPTFLDVPNIIYTQMNTYQSFPEIKVELSIKQENEIISCCRTILTPAGKLEDEMFYPPAGSTYGIKPDPEKRKYMIKDETDLEKVKYLLPEPSKFSSPSFERVKREVGNERLIYMRAHWGADHLLVDSFGLANAMIAYYENPEMLRKLVKIYCDYHYKCIERALEYQPDIIYDSWYNCSMSAGWSPAIWKDLFFPYIKANRELVRRAGVYYHFYDDGKIMPILPELKQLAPDIISSLCPPPIGDADLAKVKKELGDKTCLNGYIDLQTILRGTPDKIAAEVKNAVEIAAPGGGFWLGTSDSIRSGSPVENIRAYSQAARQYGKYPIKQKVLC
jgi:hypothetical protein